MSNNLYTAAKHGIQCHTVSVDLLLWCIYKSCDMSCDLCCCRCGYGIVQEPPPGAHAEDGLWSAALRDRESRRRIQEHSSRPSLGGRREYRVYQFPSAGEEGSRARSSQDGLPPFKAHSVTKQRKYDSVLQLFSPSFCVPFSD